MRARRETLGGLAAVVRSSSIVLASLGAVAVTFLAGWIGNAPIPPEKPRKGEPAPTCYGDWVRLWHRRPEKLPEQTAEGRPMFVLEIIHTKERIELTPTRDDGGFSQEDLDRASFALRDPGNDVQVPIDSRVLDLAYRLETHFSSRSLRIISAFRASSPRSNHGKGRALDLVVPGAADQEVAQYAQSLGFVGVGLYPSSGFVHVDSRPRSYFWLDRSGPGQRTRAVPVLAKQAEASDRKALARGELPPGTTLPAEPEQMAHIVEAPNSPRLAE